MEMSDFNSLSRQEKAFRTFKGGDSHEIMHRPSQKEFLGHASNEAYNETRDSWALPMPSESPASGLDKKDTSPSSLRQNLFIIFVTMTQMVQMMPLGAGISSGLAIGKALGATPAQSTWVVASYPLTQGAFVLIGGRLGIVYGHKNVLGAGCIWWVLSNLCGGLADNVVAMCIWRGFCGIAGGIMIPNIVALLGINFLPGNKRNLFLALFSAMAPVGASAGSLLAATVIQLSNFKWLFMTLGLFGFVVFTGAFITIPTDRPFDPKGAIDWVGAYLGVGALFLFNFAWNQAPIAGWSKAYEIAILILSILHCAAFIYWETKISKSPILPFTIWKAPSFGILALTIFLGFMSLGIFYWYMCIYMQTIRGDSLIKTGVQFLPLGIVGVGNAFFAGWLASRVPAQAVIGAACLATVIINVILATIPAHLTYWAMAFPSMVLAGCTIDFLTTSAQIIASNTVSVEQQGIAGSLVGTLLSYGLSTGLGFAGTVEIHTNHGGRDLLRGYHCAAYLGVGFATAAWVLGVAFIRIPKDIREECDQTEAKPS